MPGQGAVSDWTECSSSAEPPAVARTVGGGGGSAGHSYYQNSKGTDRIKDGHKVNSHIAKLQELWKTPQIQTIHIPKSMIDASFLKHRDLTIGQKRYLCSIAKIYNANYLRTLMKRQYMHVIQRSSQKPGVLTHHRSRLSSRYAQKQHYPCTTWRHQLDREDSGRSHVAAASASEMIIQYSLWRPVRNKEGLKSGYASKTRCKSLKIFRKPGRLFMQSVSTNDSESYMNEEKKEEDLLKCMQSMSIEEQGEHLMLT
ncbi:protein FAM216A [Diceros bicornis minor]|uniref:Protein FAM216A n=1 Tax=Ceratotherium simum simum TaxID=73337 RepID=A0ABM0HMF0_CERSS|nr:PREDICTED: protein FAM216A [Ceratotherium simum simum]XP_058387385.1 protein FAM216A [Diceros bicornis minor]